MAEFAARNSKIGQPDAKVVAWDDRVIYILNSDGTQVEKTIASPSVKCVIQHVEPIQMKTGMQLLVSLVEPGFEKDLYHICRVEFSELWFKRAECVTAVATPNPVTTRNSITGGTITNRGPSRIFQDDLTHLNWKFLHFYRGEEGVRSQLHSLNGSVPRFVYSCMRPGRRVTSKWTHQVINGETGVLEYTPDFSQMFQVDSLHKEKLYPGYFAGVLPAGKFAISCQSLEDAEETIMVCNPATRTEEFPPIVDGLFPLLKDPFLRRLPRNERTSAVTWQIRQDLGVVVRAMTETGSQGEVLIWTTGRPKPPAGIPRNHLSVGKLSAFYYFSNIMIESCLATYDPINKDISWGPVFVLPREVLLSQLQSAIFLNNDTVVISDTTCVFAQARTSAQVLWTCSIKFVKWFHGINLGSRGTAAISAPIAAKLSFQHNLDMSLQYLFPAVLLDMIMAYYVVDTC